MSVRIAAFMKYGTSAASTRQRILQYLPHLSRAGASVSCDTLLGDDYVQSLATGGSYSKAEVARAYARRIRRLRAPDADLLWVYAELFPNLPASFERLAFHSGKPVVYDIDDAFFHQYDDHNNPLIRALLRGKLEPLPAGAALCLCGNEYLRDYAAQWCPNSVVLPTVVDTDVYVPRPERAPPERPLIGWIGSPSTWCNVQPILPVLQQVAEQEKVRIRVIGAGAQAEADRFPGLEMVGWSEAAEVAEVQDMDIGIMPLLDRPFQRGKSGYKLIQYMACGLPVIASPVGVNSRIVEDGGNGFLARSPEEWRDALVKLIRDPKLRDGMGQRGRAIAQSRYSLSVTAPQLTDLMLSLVRQKAGQP
jgi:glycosyltransferase involved in cell wall biosynthesis